MTYPAGLDVARGLAVGVSYEHKFGRNAQIGTDFAPVVNGGFYRAPQVSGATQLRIKAGDAADTADGAGARSVELAGLDVSGNEIIEILATNGASPSDPTSQLFLRLYRVKVLTSGTYATQADHSHAGAIVIENAAGTEDWATIANTSIGRGQSQIACYTTSAREEIYLAKMRISSDSVKKIDIALYQRQSVLDTSTPYSAMRVVEEFTQISGVSEFNFDPPLYFPPLTDVGFLAKVTSGSADVSASFDFIEVSA